MSNSSSGIVKKNKLSVNNFRSQMQKIKMPFIENIKKSADEFHNKIKKFEQKINTPDSDSEEIQQKKYTQQVLDTEQNGDNLAQQEIDILQKRLQSKRQQESHLREWKGNLTHSFTNMEDIQKNFIQVFQKKLSIKKKQNKAKCYDFKDDQKQMLTKIFNDIKASKKGKNKNTILIQDIILFFQKNQLFYLFYNLHPNRLRNILKEYARTQNDSLTLVQFLLVFYMDRPLLLNLKDPNYKQVHRKCVLDVQGWQELKSIFTTLDTFGNQTIHIVPFFQKLKTYHSNPNLIHYPVIQFPQIQRFYTLKKIVFDLENKFKFLDKVEWKDIENIIINFTHKEEPTLDIICQQNLQKATILLQSNYFLIDSNAIQILKATFQKCPKYCEFFVNTKFICSQLLQIPSLKKYYKTPIRQKGNIYRQNVTLLEVIHSMVAKAPGFLDLDQFLEYFSIKGVVTNIILDDEQSQKLSQQEEVNVAHKIRKLEKIKSLQNLRKSRKKRTNKGKTSKKIFTDFKEFNITKKQRETIRQKKLKEMILQKQQKELNQLKKKFKANPIPAELNPQRLKAEQKKLQLRKKRRQQELEKKAQEGKEIVNYLKANTKLFQPRINAYQTDSVDKKESQHFVHKPVPWYVQQNMLQHIQNQKSERRKQLLNQTKLKYVRSWNRLPDMFFEDEHVSNQSLQNDLHEIKKNYQRCIKAKPVPDFAALHAQFQYSLQKRKKQFKPTKIQQFQLTSPKPKREHQISDETIKRSNYTMHRDNQRWRQTLHSPPQNLINTTKKTEDWVKLNQQKMAEKERKKRQLQSQQLQRINKQKNFAKFMSKKLAKQMRQMPNLQAQTSQKLKNFKKVMHMLKQQHQTELSQIYAKVLQRPFLFEFGNNNQNKSKQVKKSQRQKIKKPNMKNKHKIKTIEPISMQESNHHEQKNFPYGAPQFNNEGQEQYEDQQSQNGMNKSF